MSEDQQNTELHGSAGMKAFARAARVVFIGIVVLMLGSVVFFLFKSFFVVESSEVGIILRFGRIVSRRGQQTRLRGLHFSLPYPVDERIRVSTKPQEVSTDAFWYERQEMTDADRDADVLRPGVHGYGLTGDMSIIHSNWTLKYRIIDPVVYVTRFHDGATGENRIKEVLRLLLNRAVTQAGAGLSTDTAWQDRDAFRSRIKEVLDGDIDRLQLGIEIEDVLLSVAPPRQVKEEFDSVTQAVEERQKLVADANGEAQRLESDARIAEAEMLAAANSDKTRKISRVQADVEAFKKLYPQYQKDKELFRRIYVEERLRKIMGQVDEKFVVDKREQRQLRLELNADPRKAKNERSGDSR